MIFYNQAITNTLTSNDGCSSNQTEDGDEVGRIQGIEDQSYGKETMMGIMILRTSAEISREVRYI